MPRNIALINGLLPILAIHLTYLISAAQGHVPWCFPYLESCTSISATGRHGSAFYVFKGTMIPAAVCLMMFWYLMGRWLGKLGDSKAMTRTVFVLGVIGAIFLIVYAVALGAAGDAMRLQRRIGIILYFTLTYLPQLLVVWRISRRLPSDPGRPWLLGLSTTALAVGVATIGLDLSIDNYDNYEDAFEWILALLIHLWFLVIAVTWHRTGFKVKYVVG